MFSLPQSLEPKCFDDLRPKIVPGVVICPPLKNKKILVRVKWKEIKSLPYRKDSMPVSRRDRANTNALNPSTTKPWGIFFPHCCVSGLFSLNLIQKNESVHNPQKGEKRLIGVFKML